MNESMASLDINQFHACIRKMNPNRLIGHIKNKLVCAKNITMLNCLY